MKQFVLIVSVLIIVIFESTSQTVTHFVLVNAATDADIRTLTNNDTINMKSDGLSLNIRAEIDGMAGSVKLDLVGINTRTENMAPYALFGDNNGDYIEWIPQEGIYTLKATPYILSGGGGEAGTPLEISFTIIKGNDIITPPDTVMPGTGELTITGELKKWHKITLSFNGPERNEADPNPNPFLDFRLTVTFTNGETSYIVPGYFAADGNAANTSADEGSVWRVHFCPDATGVWNYSVSFRQGVDVAVNDDPQAGMPLPPIDGQSGTISIAETDKQGRDFRAKGRLQYVGEHYLRFAETGEYFVKQGADAPENFLAYDKFDGNFKSDGQKDQLIKSWSPHLIDWQQGDPTWGNGKGKEIIGAVNYLASKGMNVFSFLTLNIDGDDRNVFPYITYTDRLNMDVSRLEQWEVVFQHADSLGMYLHFKTQETENEMLLDNGNTGRERKLYYRELIARYAHHLALNWNLGEENGALGSVNQNTEQRKAMAEYFYKNDPYRHHIVIHNGMEPSDLLGSSSRLTGYSLQTDRPDFANVHPKVKEWVQKSAAAGKKWVVACDEPGDAQHALVPDWDDSTHNDARKNGLWGCLLAGGGGNEWYFGYDHDHSDLTCQDFRSRDLFWNQCKIALDFFNLYIPFYQMISSDDLVSGTKNWCFAKPGEVYAILLSNGGSAQLNIEGAGVFTVKWYNPRTGGQLQNGTITSVEAGQNVALGYPPSEATQDWVVLVKNENANSLKNREWLCDIRMGDRDKLHIICNNRVDEVMLYEISGKKTPLIISDNCCDLSYYKSGIYIVSVRTGSDFYRKKIFVP
jgi:hypothetical protein